MAVSAINFPSPEASSEKRSGNNPNSGQANAELNDIWTKYLSKNQTQRPEVAKPQPKVEFGKLDEIVVNVAPPEAKTESPIIETATSVEAKVESKSTTERQYLGSIVFNQEKTSSPTEDTEINEAPIIEAASPSKADIPAEKVTKKTSILDQKIDFSKTIDTAEKYAKKAWTETQEVASAIWEIIAGFLPQPKKETQDPKKEAEKAKAMAKAANIRSFFGELQARSYRALGLEQTRQLKAKSEQINRQRGATNISFMGESLIDLQSGENTAHTDQEVTEMTAEQIKQQQRQQAMRSAIKVSAGKRGAKVETNSIEMTGGNSRVMGPNATG